MSTYSNADTASTEDTFDDACTFCQFCMNPSWFLYMQACKLYERCERGKTEKCLKDSQFPPQKEPLLSTASQQIVYFVFVYGAWAVVYWKVYPLGCTSDRISDVHQIICHALLLLNFVTWRVAAVTTPGNITEETLRKFDNYAYDNVLYKPNQTCPTVGIRKIARSKFDRYTGKQVPRFDHFCGWLGQSIGEENYRLFLAFLVVHTCSCAYGTILTSFLLWSEVNVDGEATISTLDYVVQKLSRVIFIDYWLTFLTIFMGIMAAFLFAFVFFHFKLVIRGMTTNEYYKWKAIRARGTCFADEEAATNRRAIRARGTCFADEEAATNRRATAPKGGSIADSPINNIYDLGPLQNILEVLQPRCLRSRAGGQGLKRL